jgi:hypothetical protein
LTWTGKARLDHCTCILPAAQATVVPPDARTPPRCLAFRLAPAPLGDAEPPLQAVALRNPGPTPLEYALDVTPLAELARGSYGFEVLRYAGGAPLQGEAMEGRGARSAASGCNQPIP